jgi:hypothetical protein
MKHSFFMPIHCRSWQLRVVFVLHQYSVNLTLLYVKMQTRVDIDKPRYDQSTFEGRAKYFLTTTNPLNVFASDEQLDKAKELVDEYRYLRTCLSPSSVLTAIAGANEAVQVGFGAGWNNRGGDMGGQEPLRLSVPPRNWGEAVYSRTDVVPGVQRRY